MRTAQASAYRLVSRRALNCELHHAQALGHGHGILGTGEQVQVIEKVCGAIAGPVDRHRAHPPLFQQARLVVCCPSSNMNSRRHAS